MITDASDSNSSATDRSDGGKGNRRNAGPACRKNPGIDDSSAQFSGADSVSGRALNPHVCWVRGRNRQTQHEKYGNPRLGCPYLTLRPECSLRRLSLFAAGANETKRLKPPAVMTNRLQANLSILVLGDGLRAKNE